MPPTADGGEGPTPVSSMTPHGVLEAVREAARAPLDGILVASGGLYCRDMGLKERASHYDSLQLCGEFLRESLCTLSRAPLRERFEPRAQVAAALAALAPCAKSRGVRMAEEEQGQQQQQQQEPTSEKLDNDNQDDRAGNESSSSSSIPDDVVDFSGRGIPRTLVGDAAMVRQMTAAVVGAAVGAARSGRVVPFSVQVISSQGEEGEGGGLVRLRVEAGFEQPSHDELPPAMAVAKAYAACLGGTSGMEERAGRRGAWLFFDVPVGAGNDDEADVADGQRVCDGKGEKEKNREAKLESTGSTVLAVDDYAPSLTLLEMHLERLGCDVLTATSGEDALSVLRRQRVDAVFTDIDMPGIGGLGLARRVRSEESKSEKATWTAGIQVSVPIVAVSAAGGDTREEARRAGINHFVTKPITEELLRDALERFTSIRPPPVSTEKPAERSAPEAQHSPAAAARGGASNKNIPTSKTGSNAPSTTKSPSCGGGGGGVAVNEKSSGSFSNTNTNTNTNTDNHKLNRSGNKGNSQGEGGNDDECTPALDISVLLDIFPSDPGRVRGMLERVLDDASEAIETACASLQAIEPAPGKDAGAVAPFADVIRGVASDVHKFGGSAGTLGAVGLHRVCMDIEKKCRALLASGGKDAAAGTARVSSAWVQARLMADLKRLEWAICETDADIIRCFD